MKRKSIIAVLAAIMLSVTAGVMPSWAQNSSETYFPYPAVPDSMKSLQGRCDYLVHHFWDFCDLKKSFSSRKKMEQAFADYLSFMPYASRDSVMTSLGHFFKKLEKQPDDLLFIVDCAENMLTGDSAQYVSEELYIEFAKAAINNKRVDKATKARYQNQVKIMGNSMVGAKFPEFDYTDRFGNPGSMATDTADIVLVFISDPTCDDCKLARIRLDANIKAGILINRGIMKVVCLSSEEFGDEWQDGVKDYPLLWRVGTNPDIDMTVSVPTYPTFYFLDNESKIAAKDLTIDQVIAIIDRL